MLASQMKPFSESHMRCYRCNGPMIREKFYGTQEHFWGWKCICCGDVIDPVVIENRQASLLQGSEKLGGEPR